MLLLLVVDQIKYCERGMHMNIAGMKGSTCLVKVRKHHYSVHIVSKSKKGGKEKDGFTCWR